MCPARPPPTPPPLTSVQTGHTTVRPDLGAGDEAGSHPTRNDWPQTWPAGVQHKDRCAAQQPWHANSGRVRGTFLGGRARHRTCANDDRVVRVWEIFAQHGESLPIQLSVAAALLRFG